LAAYRQHAESMEILVKGGADVNSIDSGGRTPLMLVITASPRDSRIRYRCVRVLLDGGADPNLRLPGTGVSAMHLASYSRDVPAILAMIEAGGDPNAIDSTGESILLAYLRSGPSPSELRDLLHAGMVVDEPTRRWARANAHSELTDTAEAARIVLSAE
jgi:ankyrin repeat protein